MRSYLRNLTLKIAVFYGTRILYIYINPHILDIFYRKAKRKYDDQEDKSSLKTKRLLTPLTDRTANLQVAIQEKRNDNF